MGGWGGGGANPPAAPPRRFAPPLLKGGGEKRPHRRTTPPPAAAPLLKRGGEVGSTHPASLDPQRFWRQGFLPVGLDIDAGGRLALLLLPDRFLPGPRAAARSLLRPMASTSGRESGGLSLKRQCRRKTSRKRTVSAAMPTAEKGSRSIARTSTYSTPRSRSACSGRSPGRMTRFGRMVL